jgi:hypothetical protein
MALSEFRIGKTMLRLDNQSIYWETPQASNAMALSDIRRIRLNAFSGEIGTQYRLDVWPVGGKPLRLIVGSTAKDAANSLPAYANLVSQLHEALKGRHVQYETGYAVLGKVLWALAILAWGVSLALMLFAPSHKFDRVVWPAMGLVVGGFAALRFARGLKPKPYDPAAIPATLLPTA